MRATSSPWDVVVGHIPHVFKIIPLPLSAVPWQRPQNGHRIRLRYLGTAKNDTWLHTRCAAINLHTLLRHGLTRRDGAWVLA